MADPWLGLGKGNSGIEPPTETLKCHSPSFNGLFGKYYGIPRGYSAIIWATPRVGKTAVTYSFVSHLHENDPEARVVWFDTEMRASIQSTMGTAQNIDPERILIKQTNDPVEIFNFIEKDLAAAIDKGLKVPLVVIDSLSSIRGLRGMNAESVENLAIGDQARTLQEGMQRIFPILRRKGITLIATAQARAEMDQYQQRLHKTTRMSVSFGVKHLIEYMIKLTQAESKAGMFFDPDNPEVLIGAKIKAVLEESASGGKRRTAEFSLQYDKGVINVGQEVAEWASNLGVLRRPEGSNGYVFDDLKWRGIDACAQMLENDLSVRKRIIDACMKVNKIEVY